ncbi:MAG: biotin synthase BioB [Rhizobiales bacterium]|nr:biotin synthase BioB [Hyphomicrobiales bacterium]
MSIQTRTDKPAAAPTLNAARTDPDVLRHDWSREEVQALYALPFNDLMFEAQIVHRRWFKAHQVQMSTLLSIKTGGCPEDCGYCAQSAKFDTGLKASKLMEVEKVLAEARRAKEAGATRYCMGAAWREPKDRDMDMVCAMVEGVKEMGMETCMTLGMLSGQQVHRLAQSGLDYYNHNIDTSEEYYDKIVSTRSFADRLDTLERVRQAGINVCSGGIVGMGESKDDRLGMLIALANLEEHPQSVPINMLMPMEGTPLGKSEKVDPIDFVRMIAVARIMMPQSVVRLAAGRELMSEEQQALCFLAGANSIFVGDKLLTAKNPEADKDSKLFAKLGIEPMPAHSCPAEKDVSADRAVG